MTPIRVNTISRKRTKYKRCNVSMTSKKDRDSLSINDDDTVLVNVLDAVIDVVVVDVPGVDNDECTLPLNVL